MRLYGMHIVSVICAAIGQHIVDIHNMLDRHLIAEVHVIVFHIAIQNRHPILSPVTLPPLMPGPGTSRD